ncbi:MAG: 1,4-dihydroxy-2-naphthoate polyprenyltransferase [Ignavibacteria bacterium]|nr:1,4-dihydroxy-2-naphthoate polyprenyltransferase [Ignavibacteria bacterium]
MKSSYSQTTIWIMASRPKTLLAAFVPVIVGSSLAFMQGSFQPIAAFVALLCALLIQIATNFTNDLYDFLKGADNKKRVGPVRVLNAGLVTPEKMKFAIYLTFFMAFVLGLYLVYLTGTIILIVGIVSIIAGLAYTAGPYPLAYNGLGDIFVFVFFGVVGTVGTYYVQVQEISALSFLASIPVGALITNILVVNNYRDIDQDRFTGKNTLAVKLGKTFSRYEYLILMISSFFVPFIFYIFYDISLWIFLPYLTLPLAYKLVIMLFELQGEQLNSTLELTAKFSALYGLLFAIGIVM